ncbi:resolvase [Parasynechococcus sp.]|jgi:hypothetical protein|uniref:resolvase n=1 Tax=Parasynechococcus sp. TaxID=3101203 RepID=UPI003704092D
MIPRSIDSVVSQVHQSTEIAVDAATAEALVGIDEVQKSLNRSRASVYRYTNTDPRNLNPPFNPRKLNPEYRSDQKDALLFHPNEVARFAKDVLRIKEVTVEVLNSPSTATQQMLGAILDELRVIRSHLEGMEQPPADLTARRDRQDRPAA